MTNWGVDRSDRLLKTIDKGCEKRGGKNAKRGLYTMQDMDITILSVTHM